MLRRIARSRLAAVSVLLVLFFCAAQMKHALSQNQPDQVFVPAGDSVGLIRAIQWANNTGRPLDIYLETGEYAFFAPNEAGDPTLPVLTGHVRIFGQDTHLLLHTQTAAMAAQMVVEAGAHVELHHLQFVLATGAGRAIVNHGELRIFDSQFGDATRSVLPGQGEGGGIENHGALYVERSAFLRNQYITDKIEGGAIYNTGVFNATCTRFMDGLASQGGAIFNRGTVEIGRSAFEGNTANGGGAIFSADGTANASGNWWGGAAPRIGDLYAGTDTISSKVIAESPLEGDPTGVGDCQASPPAVIPEVIDTTLPSAPQTFVVTTTADSGPGSLRQAILDANLTADSDTITFDDTVFAAPQTIYLASNLPTITTSMTIDGLDTARVTISAGSTSGMRVFTIDGTINVSLTELDMVGGRCSRGCPIPTLHTYGGGLLVRNATVRIIASTLDGNRASGFGGGLYNDHGTVTILNSTFSGNVAYVAGGGIFNDGGTVNFTNSTLTGGTSEYGAGIFIRGGVLNITSATLSGNAAYKGGGLYIMSATAVNVRNTILAGNTATDSRYNDYRANIEGTPTFMVSTLTLGSPLLAPLADNGGPTKTRLLGGSSAVSVGANIFLAESATGIDYNGDGDTADTLTTDQRGTGFPRITGLGLDLGAMEVECTASPYTIAAGDTWSLQLAMGCAREDTTDDVITLTDSTYTLTEIASYVDGPYNEDDKNGLPVVRSVNQQGKMTIYGNGANIVRDPGAPTFRILQIDGGDLTLNDLTLQGGDMINPLAAAGSGVRSSGTLTLNNVGVVGHAGDGLYAEGAVTANYSTLSDNLYAGIVMGNTGSLVLTNSTVSNNAGGIRVSNTGVTGTIEGCTFTQNTSYNRGGAIYFAGTLTVRNSTFSNNTAGDYGGAIFAGILDISDSVFTNNSAKYGGGISAGTLTLVRSTISDNTASFSGGGVSVNKLSMTDTLVANNHSDDSGGGLYIYDQSSIGRSLIVGNSATGDGGGVYVYAYNTIVANTTFAGNSANRGGAVYSYSHLAGSNLSVFNTTFVDNLTTAGSDVDRDTNPVSLRNTLIVNDTCAAGVVDSGNNLQYPSAGCLSSIPVADPKLGPLADNGGPTRTFALAEISPAVGAGDAATCSGSLVQQLDQRGVLRKAICDIGAYESAFAVTPLSVGIFQAGNWWLRNPLGQSGDAGYVWYGGDGWIPVVGDWDGDGKDSPGIFKDGDWWLQGDYDEPFSQQHVWYGGPGWLPVVGDWDGDGRESPGIYKDGNWWLHQDIGQESTETEKYIWHGGSDWLPVVGDWDSDGKDSPGIFRNGNWWLHSDYGEPISEQYVWYGGSGWTPIAGDWDWDGKDSPGIFQAGNWWLRSDLGEADPEQYAWYGGAGWTPVAGRWKQ